MIAWLRRIALPLPWRVVRKRLEKMRQYHMDEAYSIEAFHDPALCRQHYAAACRIGRIIAEGDESRRRGHRVGLYAPRSR